MYTNSRLQDYSGVNSKCTPTQIGNGVNSCISFWYLKCTPTQIDKVVIKCISFVTSNVHQLKITMVLPLNVHTRKFTLVLTHA